VTPVDKLLAEPPLIDLDDVLGSMLDTDERRSYVANPNNNVVRTLAELKQYGDGILQCERFIEIIGKYLGRGSIGPLRKDIDAKIKEINREKAQSKLGSKIKIEELHTGPNGNLISNYHNGLIVGRTELYDVFNFDIFSGNTYYSNYGPWVDNGDRDKPFKQRERNDSDVTNCTAWFNTKGLDLKRHDVGHIIEALADEFQIDRYVQWMDAIPQWDNEPRLDAWLMDHCGAEDTVINRLYGRKFIISMVARCYDPGCLAKNVLILEGPQSIGKSKVPEVMGGPFYVELTGARNLDLTKADSQVVLQGASVVEIPENVVSRRSNDDMVKAYFSQKNSKIRRAYGKSHEYLPRRNVFVITLNPDGTGKYLTDPTGNIRYFIVACGYGRNELWEIDETKFRSSWPLILAEAIVAWKSGEQWWLTKEQEQLQIQQVKTREVENPAVYHIEEYLGKHVQWNEYGVRSERILAWCVQNKFTRFNNRDIVNGLKEMGFESYAFTLVEEEKKRLKGLSTRQVNLWYPIGTKDIIQKNRYGGNIPEEFAYVNDRETTPF
jgi:hypothetical protein